MQKETDHLKFSKGNGMVPGVSVCRGGWQFCCTADCRHSLVLYLYEKTGNLYTKIDLLPYHIAGNIYSIQVMGLREKGLEYEYESDGQPIRDEYGKTLSSLRKWGVKAEKEKPARNGFYKDVFDWGYDMPLKLPYHKIVAYSLHVRGFTRHPSSGVKGKGTFLGILEKIPYLNELGINQIELLPAYEFYELDVERDQLGKGHPKYADESKSESIIKINYWGYKEGSYFIPKAAYSYSKDAVFEFKSLIKALHESGIELIMQFYFPAEVNRNLVLTCLKFWVTDYHVDGFHLKGENLPIDLLATDPLLADTKLYYTGYDREHIFGGAGMANRYLAEANQEFMTDMRRFLKSDEEMLPAFLYRQRRNPKNLHIINFMTSYEGFTLYDLVSYDYKHNEANGEDNKDGTNYNYSWNCGIEGATRKKAVLALRMKQIKNAFVLILLSQGTPMLLAGDEFCNTQYGNNNAYCQDNETTWLNWKQSGQSKELFNYVKQLIVLRKTHPILHKEEELRIMDYAGCGYPDLSYHGEAAWYPKMENHIRHIGIMLCGKYARIDKKTEDIFFFIAYNMHWEPHHFGLPKLPKGMKWQYCLDTTGYLDGELCNQTLVKKQDEITVSERSILILTGC